MKNIFLIFIFLFFAELNCQEWISPKGINACVIYYQGSGDSQAEASGYMINRGFKSPTTGEKIICNKGIDIIQDIWVAPELSEVVLAARKECLIKKMLHPWQTFQEHMIRKSYVQAGIRVLSEADESPKKTLAAHSINWPIVTFGQHPDLIEHRKRVESFCQEPSRLMDDQIWMGPSRGAAVTFLAAALANKENPRLLDPVKLIILEGCYGSVDSTLHTLYNSRIYRKAIELLFTTFTAYKKDGINPFDMVRYFPKHIPVAFITSKIDKQVPELETEKLVRALMQEGHENVYLQILGHSEHGSYISGNKKDAKHYEDFMHALFQQLNLPYIPKYANEGRGLVAAAKMNAQALK